MSILETIARRRAVVATIATGAALMLASCDRNAAPMQASPETEAPSPASIPTADPAPRPSSALSRTDLISAAGQAASAYAQGDAGRTDGLVGRNFSVRQPFGCTGPRDGADADGLARWNWGPDRKTIQLSLTPGDWTRSALIGSTRREEASPSWEAVEGFWIPRPWLAAETCPADIGDPLQTAETPPSPQTLGIAAVFEVDGSRFDRRAGRAYAFTIRSQGNAPIAPPDSGYRLRLEGRVVGFPDGRAFKCRAPGPDQRPVCIAAVQVDKVAFEDARGAVLSEWS